MNDKVKRLYGSIRLLTALEEMLQRNMRLSDWDMKGLMLFNADKC